MQVNHGTIYSVNARDIIERLAQLDESPGVETAPTPTTLPNLPKPTTRPGTTPAPRPNPRPHRPHDPYENPKVDAPPKARNNDEITAISEWLAVTEQPMQDWEWDGSNLRILMKDGSVETYDRAQLEDAGVFASSFSESVEDDEENESDEENKIEDELDSEDDESEEEQEEETSIRDQEPGEEFEVTPGPSNIVPLTPGTGANACSGLDATMCGILGMDATTGIEGEDPSPEQKLSQAVSDMAQAIIGIVGGDTGVESGADPDGDITMSKPDPRPDEAYPADQLEKGEEVESEHTDDDEVAKKITKDHIDENPDDYSGDDDDDEKEKE